MRPPRTRYAKAGDLSIAYQVSGSGPRDIVVTPGFVSHLDLFWEDPRRSRFMQRLGSVGRVITFDKRGTGLSDRPVGGAPSLEERMDDIRVVMDAAGSERAVLIGLSEGAPMSLLFAATYPDRTTALVLYGGFARLPAPDDFEANMELLEKYWGSGQVLPIFMPTADREWAARYERSAATPSMAVAQLRLNTQIDVTAALPAVQVPTLVMHNRGDPIVPFSNAEDLVSRIDGAQLVVRDDDTHGPMDDDSWDAMIGEVEEFLTGARHVEPDRVLATVMFTDIVASTEQVAALGDAVWRQRLDQHNVHAQRLITQYRGRHVKSMGDGTLATFDGPARALRCAAALVARAASENLPIRVGVHTGEVELMGDDIGGIAVHIAKRVESAATPGEVWVSQTVRDLVVGSGIVFSDRGTSELKGIPGTWSLFRVDAVD